MYFYFLYLSAACLLLVEVLRFFFRVPPPTTRLRWFNDVADNVHLPQPSLRSTPSRRTHTAGGVWPRRVTNKIYFCSNATDWWFSRRLIFFLSPPPPFKFRFFFSIFFFCFFTTILVWRLFDDVKTWKTTLKVTWWGEGKKQ